MKKKKVQSKKQENNLVYTHILILFSGLFLLLIAYLVRFQIQDSREVINNSYNARLDAFEERVIRGSILASNGETLAYTQIGTDGTEQRIYPYGCTFSHVLGYSEYGKTGIESLGNFQLITSNAYFVERFMNELQEQKNVGDSLVTTLDVNLQTIAHDALGTHQGAVVVMEASTGNIRALVSKPDYDPEEIKNRWNEFSSSDNGILLNRACQGLYPPGSVFKTVTLLEYLREHRLNDNEFSYVCEGKVNVGNSSISCYHGNQHGELDLKSAFAKSCNSAFADIGRNLQTNSMNELANQLLFNCELPLSLPYNQSSFQIDNTDTEAVKMQTAIGQGSTLVTPMHIAMLFSAIANDGVLMVPRFLERTENYTGALIEEYDLETYGNLLTAEEADTLEDYLRAVVEEGTASALQSDQYIAYGKTGTAEYSSDKSKSHAWFAGYVKGSKSDLVVCVLVEEAGSGSEYAVPIARKIFDAYYASE